MAQEELRNGHTTLRLGVLASHAGLTLMHLLKANDIGTLDARVNVVISNNSKSGALEIARANGISAVHISSRTHPGGEQVEITRVLLKNNVQWVVLAGWAKLIGEPTLSAYRGRILNVHPALSSTYGGVGMYGDDVHRAVLKSSAPITGAKIHLVDEYYDEGPEVSRVAVPVLPNDDVDALSQRVKEAERALLVDTLNRIARGELLREAPAPDVPSDFLSK